MIVEPKMHETKRVPQGVSGSSVEVLGIGVEVVDSLGSNEMAFLVVPSASLEQKLFVDLQLARARFEPTDDFSSTRLERRFLR